MNPQLVRDPSVRKQLVVGIEAMAEALVFYAGNVKRLAVSQTEVHASAVESARSILAYREMKQNGGRRK